jgi:nucleoside-diphosphate-sugar epimerase
MPTRKILVTGGTGFLGKRFLESIEDSSDTFLVITRKATLPSTKNIQYLEADLNQIESLERIAAKIQDCEVLIDLAAMIPSKENKDSFNAYLEANFNSHITLLKQCGGKLKKIIYASTIDVYGPMKSTPLKETQQTLPSTAYGTTKLFLEHYYRFFCDENNIDLVTLRLSQIYGPTEPRMTKVIPIFVNKVLNDQTLKIYGSGEDLRRYLYIDDAADSIKLALSTNQTGAYNVAGEDVSSMNQLVALLGDISSKQLDVEKVSGGPRKDYYMDISKIKQELGFLPKFTLKEGLEEILKP